MTRLKKRDHEEKWMESESGKSMANKSKKKPPKKQNKSMSSEPEISVTVEDLGVSLDIDINEDWDLGDIWDVMNLVDPESFEANEKETLKMIRKADRVCMPRELGDWITVKVKGGVRKGEGKWEGGSVKCNCNRCNFDGRCKFVQTFESLQFDNVPPNLAAGEALNFKTKIVRAVRVARQLNIDVASDLCSLCPPQLGVEV